MNDLILYLIVGAFAGVISVIIADLLKKPRVCPKCKTQMPKSRFRKPANLHQMLWGGWTCPKCGCELDRKGNLIKKIF